MKTFYTKPGFKKNKYTIICCLATIFSAQVFGQSPGQALQLNGGQCATMTVGFNNVYNDYAVEAWVRPMNATNTMTIFSTRGSLNNSSSDNGFDMKLQGGNTIHADIPNLNGTTYSWANTAADIAYNYTVGHWYHIAYVVSGSGQFIKIYVNGVLQRTITQTFNTAWLFDAGHGTGYIGSNRGNNANEDFIGSIDEVKIYNASNINPASDAVSTSTGNAIAYYHFDNSTQSSAAAATNAALVGSPGYTTSYALQLVNTSGSSNIAGGFTANWSVSGNTDVTGCYVDVATDAAFSNIFLTRKIASSTSSGVVSGLVPGTQYYYRISLNNSTLQGQGVYSNTATVTTGDPAPAAFSYPQQGAFTKGTAISTITPGQAPAGTKTVLATGFQLVRSLAINNAGNIYAADVQQNAILKISGTNGSVSTFATGFNQLAEIITDADGNVYATDQLDNVVKKISPQGTIIKTIGGLGEPGPLTIDRQGNLYVTTADGFRSAIMKVDTATGALTLLYTHTEVNFYDLDVDPSGNLFVLVQSNTQDVKNGYNTLYAGTSNLVPTTAALADGREYIDVAGNMYNLQGYPSSTIAKLSPAGVQTIVASGVDAPQAITVDASGNVYISDNGMQVVKYSSLTSGTPTGYSISTALPSGLLFNTSNGQISGTPTAIAAQANYTVTASNSVGSQNTTVSITVNDAAPASISYSASPFIFGKNKTITSQTPAVTGGTPASYAITPALPSGLLFNTSTGTISGTPSAASAQTNYQVTATNITGSVSTTIAVTVVDPPATVSYSASSYAFGVNIAIPTLTPSYTGGAPSGYSISPSLPSGLSFNATTGAISGTPTAVGSATNYTVTATNPAGSANVTTSISVLAAPTSLSYSGTTSFTFVKNVAISTLMPSNSGGAASSYSISPALPAGLNLNTTTGYISGTPTVITANSNYTVTATNAGGQTSVTISLQVTYPAGATVYVDAANGNDANDGSGSFSNAFKTLGVALQSAATNPNITNILLAAGTYYPAGTAAATAGNSDSAFAITRNGIRLYGGYNATTGLRNAAVNKTYLDGNSSSYHILVISGVGAGDSVIADGITIQNGKALGSGPLHVYNGTGFNSNEGAGVAAKNNSGLGNKLLFRNCTFINNTSDNDGAAFYNAETSPVFVNCLFANNAAAVNGGAMFNYDGSNPVFSNCTIAYNVSAKGAAIDNYGNCTPVLNNTIVWLNGTSSGTNNSGITSNTTPVATGSNSIIQGGVGSNSMANPLFISAASGNFAVTALSPAVNAGSNTLYTGNINTDADLNGNTRLTGGTVDIGAYEAVIPTKIYVDSAAGSDSNDGSAWGKALKTLSGALKITALNTASDTIYVAAGTYYPAGTASATAANGDSAFAITHNGLRLYGGYNATTGVRNPAVNKTNLDGNNSSYHILVIAGIGAGDSVIVDGITIQHALVTAGTTGHTYNGIAFNSDEGAGVAIRNNSALGNKLLFNNCAFINNNTSNNGAAVYNGLSSPAFVNCLFANNSGRSGTMFSYDHCKPLIVNCTFANNVVTADGGALTNLNNSIPEVDNSIIWLNGTGAGANNSGITNDGSSSVSGSNNVIQGGDAGGINSDPLFNNAAGGNYTLSPSSPAFNTGSNGLYIGNINTDADLKGNNRLVYTTIDMGAYEYGGPYNLTYAGSPFIFVKETVITPLTPSANGNTATGFTISPALPAGLSINASTGTISGTPQDTTATISYTITADNNGGAVTTTISIKVKDVPPSGLAYTGSPFTFTTGVDAGQIVPASAGGAANYSISPALPGGLSLNTSTGAISGTPTAASAATDYTITATNSGGSTSVTINITVNDVAPVTLSYTPATYTFNQAIAATTTAPSVTGSNIVYTIAPALPSGLSINGSTGVISGTPTATSPSTDYTVTATNTGGSTSAVINITVKITPPTGLTYGATSFTFAKDSALAPLTPAVSGTPAGFSINPALPAGLNFNTSTGVITGTPSAITARTSYTITAINDGGSQQVTLQLAVVEMAPRDFAYATTALLKKDSTITPFSPTAITPGSITSVKGLNYISGVTVDANFIYYSDGSAIYKISRFDSTVTKLADVPGSAIGQDAAGNLYTAYASSSYSGSWTSVVTVRKITPGGAVTTVASVFANSLTGSPATAVDAAGNVYYGDVYNNTVKRVTPAGVATVFGPTFNGAIYGLAVNPANGNIYVAANQTYITILSPDGTVIGKVNGLGNTLNGGFINNLYSCTVDSLGIVYALDFANNIERIKPDGTITKAGALPYYLTPQMSTDAAGNIYLPESTGNYPLVKITAAGGNTTAYSLNTGADALPAGLVFNTATGVISGTPTDTTAHPVTCIISAVNSGGRAGAVLTLSVKDVPPAGLSYAGSPFTFTRAAAITPQVPAVSGGPVAAYSITPALPNGLVLDAATGIISGTPTDTTIGQLTFTINASNSGGSISTTIKIKVIPVAPYALSYPGTPFTFIRGVAITPAIPSASGDAVNIYTISSDAPLPAGITFNTQTGTLSGTPLEITTGLLTYTITAYNSSGHTSCTLQLGVEDAALSSITYNGSPFTFTNNTAIEPLVPAVSGGLPTTFSLSTSPSALPAGLTFDASTGTISGTPTDTTSQPITCTITVQNGANSVSTNIQVEVKDAVPQIGYGSVTLARGIGANITPSSTGGPVVVYHITPALTNGLVLNTATGVISGTPADIAPQATYTITASNSGGTATATINITVAEFAPGDFSYNSPNTFARGHAITPLVPVTATNGNKVTLGTGIDFAWALSLGGDYFYVSEANEGSVKKVSKLDGTTTTVAGGFYSISDVAADAGGNIYVIDQGTDVVEKITPDGSLTTLATGLAAYKLALDAMGNLFVATYNGTISKITPAGDITPFAAAGVNGLSISSIAVNQLTGDVYVGTYFPSHIVKVSADGNTVTSIPGTFGDLQALTIDPSGNLYVSVDYPAVVEKVTDDGTISNAVPSDGDYYYAIAVDAAGNIYTTSWNTGLLQKIQSAGGKPENYSISPTLPAGLAIGAQTGIISGTPTTASTQNRYVVTASNSAGSTIDTLYIEVTGVCGAPTTSTSNVTVCSTALPYRWNGTDYNTPGTYTYTTANAAGCDSIATLVLNVVANNLSATLTAPGALICYGSPVIAIATHKNGLAPYQYSIDGGATYQDLPRFRVAEGAYSVTIKDAAGCIAVSNTVTVKPGPDTAIKISITQNPECNTANGTITLSATGGYGQYMYSIDSVNYQHGNTFNVTVPASYRVFVKDSAGCLLKRTFNTAHLSATLVAPRTALCNSGMAFIHATVSGGSAPYQYSFDSGASYQDTARLKMPAGTHTAIVKDAAGCLVTTNSVALFDTDRLVMEAIKNIDCAGNNGSIILNTTGGYGNYLYTIDSINYQPSNIFNVTVPGTYRVFVKDSVGCFNKKTVVVGHLSATANVADSLLCNAGYATIHAAGKDGSATYQYSFDGGVHYQDSNHLRAPAGTYAVTVKDAAGCTAAGNTITLAGIPLPLQVTASHTNVSCNGGNDGSIIVTASGGYASLYMYSINGGGYQAGGLFNSLPAGLYKVAIKDSNACIVSKNITITQPLTPCSSFGSAPAPTSSTRDITGDLKVKVFPNPAETEFNLEVVSGDVRKVVEIRVVDMLGRTVYATRGSVYEMFRFGRTFAGGTYIAEVLNGNSTQRIKLVKAE